MSPFSNPFVILSAFAALAYAQRNNIVTAVRNISARGLALLKEHEGFRAHVYRDSAGHPTIGYGHKLLPGESFPNGITQEQALQLLAKDTEIARRAIQTNVKVPLTQNQFDALTSLVFNIGTGAFVRSTLLKLLNQGFYQAASEQFLAWKFAGGVPILLGRRQKEKALFDTPGPTV